MKFCTTCGNDIGDRVWKCPYCEQQQTGPPPEPNRQLSVRSINLKEGLPIVAGAITKLKREVQNAKADRIKVLRIIHGYGSTGVGGEIKVGVREQLQSMLASKKILGFLPGDEYSDRTNAGSALISRHPSLKSSLRTDAENPGITFVEL